MVWRRSGEVSLVSKEFTLITGFSKEELLSKITYCYELMDNGSAVNYWKNFSKVAFETSQHSIPSYCNLKRKTNMDNLKCAFSFTIKRDIFDIPLVIVGSVSSIINTSFFHYLHNLLFLKYYDIT